MVRIVEDQTIAQGTEIIGFDAFDGAERADRHEHGCLDPGATRREETEPCMPDPVCFVNDELNHDSLCSYASTGRCVTSDQGRRPRGAQDRWRPPGGPRAS